METCLQRPNSSSGSYMESREIYVIADGSPKRVGSTRIVCPGIYKDLDLPSSAFHLVFTGL